MEHSRSSGIVRVLHFHAKVHWTRHLAYSAPIDDMLNFEIRTKADFIYGIFFSAVIQCVFYVVLEPTLRGRVGVTMPVYVTMQSWLSEKLAQRHTWCSHCENTGDLGSVIPFGWPLTFFIDLWYFMLKHFNYHDTGSLV